MIAWKAWCFYKSENLAIQQHSICFQPPCSIFTARISPLAFIIVRDLRSSLNYIEKSLSGLEELAASHANFKQLAPSYSLFDIYICCLFKQEQLKDLIQAGGRAGGCYPCCLPGPNWNYNKNIEQST